MQILALTPARVPPRASRPAAGPGSRPRATALLRRAAAPVTRSPGRQIRNRPTQRRRSVRRRWPSERLRRCGHGAWGAGRRDRQAMEILLENGVGFSTAAARIGSGARRTGPGRARVTDWQHCSEMTAGRRHLGWPPVGPRIECVGLGFRRGTSSGPGPLRTIRRGVRGIGPRREGTRPISCPNGEPPSPGREEKRQRSSGKSRPGYGLAWTLVNRGAKLRDIGRSRNLCWAVRVQ